MNDVKRNTLLLAVLYLSFVSLGLPDSVLGVAWPSMRASFGKPLETAGLLLGMTTALSVLSSLGAGFIANRWGTGVIIAVCAFMTAGAMAGYATSSSWAHLLFFTMFFGLGQGAVDTAVNAHMARHYSARHMNWVHCCWGIGATGGSLIMTAVFGLGFSWRGGYAAIGAVQTCLALVFLCSLTVWKTSLSADENAKHLAPEMRKTHDKQLSRSALAVAYGAGTAFYLLYPGVELVIGLWAASYLVEIAGASPAEASASVALFWASLTTGRFLTGVVATRVAGATLLRGGIALALAGAALATAADTTSICRIALAIVGVGIAPLYPTMMHDTPRRVGLAHSDKLVGFQVGAALAGSACIPALVGVVARSASLQIFGYALLLFLCLILIAHETSLFATQTAANKKDYSGPS